jgi:hypothetical protein
LGGIVYFVYWLLKRSFGITISGLLTNPNAQIAAGAIVLIITALIGPILVQSYEQKIELKNEAYAIQTELTTFQSRWNIIKQDRGNYSSISVHPKFPLTVIYPKTGLYYIYNKEIYRFSRKLSQNLSTFYDDATSAEEYREDLSQYLDRKTEPMTVTFTVPMWNEYDLMIRDIVDATNKADGTIYQLKRVQDDLCPFDFC